MDKGLDLLQIFRSPSMVSEQRVPWYVHALMLLGSIFGMLLIMAMIIVAELYEAPGVLFVLGMFLCILAVGLRILSHYRDIQIFQMTLLTLLISGQIMIVFYFVDKLDFDAEVWLLIMLMQILLFISYPDGLYRLIALPLAFICLHAYAIDASGDSGPTIALILCLFAFCIFFIIYSKILHANWLARAAYQGLLPTLLGFLAYHSAEQVSDFTLWIFYVFLLLTLVLMFFMILRQSGLNATAILVTLLGWFLLSGLAFSTPAVAIALLLCSATYLSWNRRSLALNLVTVILCGLGFLVFLFQYYYLLDLTLLEKSIRLMLSGGLLLSYTGLVFALRDKMQSAEVGHES